MTKVYLWTKVAFACATVLIAELAALAADMPVKAPPPRSGRIQLDRFDCLSGMTAP
jgi:hypothetical protein